MQASPTSFGTGMEFVKSFVTLVNRTGSTLSAGDVVQVDLTQSSSSTTGNAQGADTSLYSGAVTPYASGSPFVFYAIAMETVAAGLRFRAMTAGRVIVPVTSFASVPSGDGVLVVRNGSTRLRVEVSGIDLSDAAVGFNVGATTASATAQSVEVQFDGVESIRGSNTALGGTRTTATWLRNASTASILPFTTATLDLEVSEATPGDTLISNVPSGGMQFEQHVTDNADDNASGRITSAAVTSGAMNPTLNMRVLTGASIAAMGLYFGFVESSFMLVDNATTEHCAGFRYNTASTGNTTGFWTTVTCDGSTENAVVTTATIAVSTQYDLKIVYESATPSVLFYINNVLVATHTTNIPAVGDALLVELMVKTNTTATKRMAWAYAKLQEGLLTT